MMIRKMESCWLTFLIEIWKEMVEVVLKPDLKQVLIECANAVSNNDFSTAQCLISELQQMVSVSREPIQRLGAYMLEGLVARLFVYTLMYVLHVIYSVSAYTYFEDLWLRNSLFLISALFQDTIFDFLQQAQAT